MSNLARLTLSTRPFDESHSERRNALARNSVVQRLWFSLLQKSWNTLAVVPADASVPAGWIAESLVAVGRLHAANPVRFIDGTGTRLADVQTVADSMRFSDRDNAVIVAVDPLSQNPAALHLARSTSAVLMAVRLGESRVSTLRKVISQIGADRVVGSVVVG